MSPAHVLTETAKVATADNKESYGQILKSSALIGGSSAINIVIGIIRTKAMAVLLGPSGFGLMGVYGSILDLAQSIAGMGISSSGVRQIASATGSGDTNHIARTVVVLRRTSIVLGIVGAVLLTALSWSISDFTFGTHERATAVALLSLALLFRLISAGQGALLQGMRHISDLAKMNMLGAAFGAIASIAFVYFWQEDGVVLALVAIAAMSVITSWWFSRKVQIQSPAMSMSEIKEETAALLKLGFAFMASGLLTMGAAYAVRMMVIRMVSLEAAGYYQAAWTLGGLYVGFILQAMGADFYPRLTAVAQDNDLCNRLVNEQTQIGLLLAGPGVIATLVFTPLVTTVFYSSQFEAAVEVLRWICVGVALRVITWPMGYIIIAKGEQTIFFLAELAWTIVNIGLSWVCLNYFGLTGAGIAFLGSYVFHWLLVNSIVRRISGFRWAVTNRNTGLLFLFMVSVVFGGLHLLPPLVAIGIGALAVMLSGVYSLRVLLNLISMDRITCSMKHVVGKFRFVRSAFKL
ncbi:MAG: O-antigen translocase [Nitrospira sp.]|nr:O-antigen translocase [Nitrospira sp.]